VEVLEHLVGVHEVDAGVGELEVIGVADGEVDLDASLLSRPLRLGDDLAAGIEAENAPWRHALGHVDGDRPRTAADVEHDQPRPEISDQVGG
jgi:hypothetical protein